jgi:hypothetical protein
LGEWEGVLVCKEGNSGERIRVKIWGKNSGEWENQEEPILWGLKMFRLVLLDRAGAVCMG